MQFERRRRLRQMGCDHRALGLQSPDLRGPRECSWCDDHLYGGDEPSLCPACRRRARFNHARYRAARPRLARFALLSRLSGEDASADELELEAATPLRPERHAEVTTVPPPPQQDAARLLIAAPVAPPRLLAHALPWEASRP